MNTYKSYITTKFPWLLKMPNHWDTMRAKYMYQKESRAVSETDEVITCFRDGVVTLRKNRRTTGFTESIQESGYQGIRKGDLVIHVMDAFAGAVGVSDSNGKGTPVYSVCTAKCDYNNYYYAHIVREMARSGFIQSLYRGIRQRSSDFRFEIFAAQYLPVPPREEQDQIVRYLDWQVSKTNKLISALKKQIALLKQQKQAVINEAVTKGLDPNVPMKDSGIEWCGEIPAEWRIDKIPRLFSSIGSGTTPASGNAKYYRDGTIPWINSGDLYTDKKRVESAGKSVNELALTDYSVLKLYQEAACVIAMYGASIGNAAIVDFPFCCNQACCVLSDPREDLLLDYIYYCTSTFKRYLIEKSRGGGQPNISQDMIRKVWIPLPDIDTQKKIVEYIDVQCAKTDALIESINWEITLLKEYRTRLISDVVTGQIDVRDIEVPEFEYIADEADDASDDENTDAEEMVEEEE